MIRDDSPLHLYILSHRSTRISDNSFAGERETIEHLVESLGITRGFVVDIAASDGYSQSSTLGLFRRSDWCGLAVEMDPIKFFKLAYLYRNFCGSRLVRHRVTPNNVSALLAFCEVPLDFDVLNLDIDSYDLDVLDALLNGGFRPRIVSMEINEKIPSGICFSVKYHDDHYWKKDHFYGCSLDAATRLMNGHGYLLYKLEYNNAFYVRRTSAHAHLLERHPSEAYQTGYMNRPDRGSLFPWNSDVEAWLYMDRETALQAITTYFDPYNGRYEIELTEVPGD